MVNIPSSIKYKSELNTIRHRRSLQLYILFFLAAFATTDIIHKFLIDLLESIHSHFCFILGGITNFAITVVIWSEMMTSNLEEVRICIRGSHEKSFGSLRKESAHFKGLRMYG